jgi:hypothetical protein
LFVKEGTSPYSKTKNRSNHKKVIFNDPEQDGKRPRLGAEGENGIPHCRSKETLTILGEGLWLIEGSLSEDSIPDMYRDGLREYGG